MKRAKLLKKILKRTNTDKIITIYIGYFFLTSFIILLVEPSVNEYKDSLWYLFQAATTIGFGDIQVVTVIGRVATVLFSIYSVFIIALITGVVVNYYTQVLQLEQKNSIEAFLEKLEKLDELTKEELKELSNKIKEFNRKN